MLLYAANDTACNATVFFFETRVSRSRAQALQRGIASDLHGPKFTTSASGDSNIKMMYWRLFKASVGVGTCCMRSHSASDGGREETESFRA